MPATKTTLRCLACRTDADDIPLISLTYRGVGLWICPQHMPVLIHDPVQLLNKLPSATKRKRAKATSPGKARK